MGCMALTVKGQKVFGSARCVNACQHTKLLHFHWVSSTYMKPSSKLTTLTVALEGSAPAPPLQNTNPLRSEAPHQCSHACPHDKWSFQCYEIANSNVITSSKTIENVITTLNTLARTATWAHCPCQPASHAPLLQSRSAAPACAVRCVPPSPSTLVGNWPQHPVAAVPMSHADSAGSPCHSAQWQRWISGGNTRYGSH